MRYLKGTIHYKTLTSVIQLIFVLSHGQAAVERAFSLNDKLLVENMKAESLIAQPCIKEFMLANNYSAHTVPITEKLMDNSKSSSQRYKAYLEEQRQSKKEAEQSKEMLDLDEELLSLNIDMKLLKDAIIEYQNETDKFAIEAEKRKNFELLTMSNSLKRSAKDKQPELDNLVKKSDALKKKSKHYIVASDIYDIY